MATDVVVANLSGRPSPHLVEIGGIDLDLNAWQLLRGVVEVDALHLFDTDLHIEPDAEGRFRLAANVEALTEEPPREPVALRIHAVEAEGLRVFYLPRPGDATVSARFERLSVRAEPLEGPLHVVVRGEVDGGPFDLRAQLGPLAELLEPSAPYPLRVQGRVLEAKLEAEGTVGEPRRLRGLDVAISGTLPDLAVLSHAFDRELPGTGPIRVSTRLTNADGPFALRDLRIVTERAKPLRAEITGSIADLGELRGIELELDMHAEGPELLNRLAQRQIDVLRSLDAGLTVSDGDGSLGIEGEMHARGRDDSVAIDLVGGYDALSGISEIDVRAGLRARNTRIFARALGVQRQLPDIGPIVANGRLRDRDGTLGVEDLELRIGRHDDTWLELRGSIRDVIRMAGVQLEASFGTVDLRHLRVFLEREPPALGPFQGTASVSDHDGSLGIERFEVGGGDTERLRIDLVGAVDDLRETDEITVEGSLSAHDLALVGQLFDVDLPEIGPVEFEGRVTGSNESMVSEGTAHLDETTLHGKWSASFATGERPRLWARLVSPRIRLRDVGIEPRHEPRDRLRRKRPTPAREEGLFGSGPLPFEWLRKIDVDVGLRAERVTGRSGLELRDVKQTLHIKDGELVIRDFDARWRGGRLGAELRIDSRTPYPVLVLNAEVTEIDVARLVSQFEDEPESAGIIDLSVGLRAEGRTSTEIRSSLAGRVWVVVRDGVATSAYVNEFLRTLIHLSIPSLRVHEAIAVGCTVGEFGVEDGVATVETLVLAGKEATITGQGTVDIGRGKYDLRLTPRVHDPGVLSVAVAVDVSGPLRDPEFRPVHRTIATSAARAVVSNLMRPGRFVVRSLPGGAPEESKEDFCARAQASRPEIQSFIARDGRPISGAR